MNDRRRVVLVMPDADVASSLRDAERAREDHQIVAVLGSGAGWYAALAVAGVIGDEAAMRLSRDLVLATAGDPAASRVIYPLTDAAWQPDVGLRADLEAAIEAALAASHGDVRLSVDLGAYGVVDGSPSGIDALVAALPAIRVGERHYPLRLSSRGGGVPPPDDAAHRLLDEPDEVDWQMPNVTLIDARGIRHTPWSADAATLRDYTLGPWRSETEDIAAAARVALREHAPDAIVVAGRAGILGAVCGQLVVAEGFQGVRSRHAFLERQRRRPIILTMRH